MPRTGRRQAGVAALHARLERVQALLTRIEKEVRALRRIEDLAAGPDPTRGATSMGAAAQRAERDFILRLGERCAWNRSQLAEALDVSRTTLYRKLKEHGLETRRSEISGAFGPRRTSPRPKRARR